MQIRMFFLHKYYVFVVWHLLVMVMGYGLLLVDNWQLIIDNWLFINDNVNVNVNFSFWFWFYRLAP